MTLLYELRTLLAFWRFWRNEARYLSVNHKLSTGRLLAALPEACARFSGKIDDEAKLKAQGELE